MSLAESLRPRHPLGADKVRRRKEEAADLLVDRFLHPDFSQIQTVSSAGVECS